MLLCLLTCFLVHVLQLEIVTKAKPSLFDAQALSCRSIWAVWPSAHLFLLFLFDFNSAVLWLLPHFLYPDPNPCKTVSPRTCINVSQYPRNTFMGPEKNSKVLSVHVDCLSYLPQNNDKTWNFYYFPEKIQCLLSPSFFPPTVFLFLTSFFFK